VITGMRRHAALDGWAAICATVAPYLIFPSVLADLILTLRRKRVLPAVAVLLVNPLGLFFLDGIRAYLGGLPAKYYSELQDVDPGNLDPKTRCMCERDAPLGRAAWVFNHPRNLALDLMCWVFGWPSGTYTGPCPTKAEAFAATLRGGDVLVSDLLADRVRVGDRVCQLEEGVGKTLCWSLAKYRDWLATDEQWQACTAARAAFVGDGCLVLHFPGSWWDFQAEVLVLIDADKGRPFAHHRIGRTGILLWLPVYYDDPKGVPSLLAAAHVDERAGQAGETVHMAPRRHPDRRDEEVRDPQRVLVAVRLRPGGVEEEQVAAHARGGEAQLREVELRGQEDARRLLHAAAQTIREFPA
jgi:hypothetical protein